MQHKHDYTKIMDLLKECGKDEVLLSREFDRILQTHRYNRADKRKQQYELKMVARTVIQTARANKSKKNYKEREKIFRGEKNPTRTRSTY